MQGRVWRVFSSLATEFTEALAKGDAGVVGDLQELFMKTRQATGGSGE